MRALLPLLLVGLAACAAEAGVLIEGRLEGLPLRLELAGPGEPESGIVRVTVAGELRLVDIERGTVEPAAAGRAAPPPGGRDPGLVSLTPLGGGAMIAGFGGAWQIVTEDGRVCGEVLASAWMLRFLEPAIRAIELLEASDPRLRPQARHGCSPLGFRVWTRQGWPLLVGGRTDRVFVTEQIRFDHPRLPAATAPPPR